MKRYIALCSESYPKEFDECMISVKSNESKVKHVEERLINKVNEFNPKLNIEEIQYFYLEQYCASFKGLKSTGIIFEEDEIDSRLVDEYSKDGYTIFEQNGKKFYKKIMYYLILSKPTEAGRNGFISQRIFPAVIDCADEFFNSPSYTIANHEFIFINILNKEITSKMILRDIGNLRGFDFHYIELFKNSIDYYHLSRDLKTYMEEFFSNWDINYDLKSNEYVSDNYIVDFNSKIFKIKTEKLEKDLITKKAGNVKYIDFNGSNEKFFWMDVFSLCGIAYKDGYKVDYTEYENFINTYDGKFSPKSSKFIRSHVVLKYIKKCFC